MRTHSAYSEHKRREIERFSTLKIRLISTSITQSSKLKRLRHCQLSVLSKFNDVH